MLWYRLFTKYWQRREAYFAMRWGVDAHQGSTLKKLRNHRLQAKMMPSPENEKKLKPQVSANVKLFGRALSGLVTFAFVVLLFAVVILEHFTFFYLSQFFTSPHETSLLQVLFGAFCGGKIKLVDIIWDWLSDWIIDLECRTHDRSFEEAKRLKASIVKFVTSMITPVFFAFVQPLYLNDDCVLDISSEVRNNFNATQQCLQQARNALSTQLCATFFTRYILLFGVFYELVKPEFTALRRRRMREQLYGYKEGFIESQVHMETYGTCELTNDYL